MLFVGSKLTHQFNKWSFCKWFRSCIQVTKNIQQMILLFVLKVRQCKFYIIFFYQPSTCISHTFFLHHLPIKQTSQKYNVTGSSFSFKSWSKKYSRFFCIINLNYELYECMYINWIYMPGVRSEWTLPIIKEKDCCIKMCNWK